MTDKQTSCVFTVDTDTEMEEYLDEFLPYVTGYDVGNNIDFVEKYRKETCCEEPLSFVDNCEMIDGSFCPGEVCETPTTPDELFGCPVFRGSRLNYGGFNSRVSGNRFMWDEGDFYSNRGTFFKKPTVEVEIEAEEDTNDDEKDDGYEDIQPIEEEKVIEEYIRKHLLLDDYEEISEPEEEDDSPPSYPYYQDISGDNSIGIFLKDYPTRDQITTLMTRARNFFCDTDIKVQLFRLLELDEENNAFEEVDTWCQNTENGNGNLYWGEKYRAIILPDIEWSKS